MKEIISLIVLSTPVLWELFNDRNGDIHPNNDWLIRGLIMLASAVVVSIGTDRSFLQALTMSFGIFSLIFPYLYNILNGKKPWYNYLSKTAIPDKWTYWAGTPWYGRMIILLIVFLTCFSIYFWKEMMIWNYPYGR